MPKETPSLYEEIGNGIKVASHLLSTRADTPIGISRGVNVVTEGPKSLDEIRAAIGKKLSREVTIAESPFAEYREADTARKLFAHYSFNGNNEIDAIQSQVRQIGYQDKNWRLEYIKTILEQQMARQKVAGGSTEIKPRDKARYAEIPLSDFKESAILPAERCKEIASYLEAAYSQASGSVFVQYDNQRKTYYIETGRTESTQSN